MLLRSVHMIPNLSVCGLVVCTSRTLCWAVCWMLRHVRSKTLWRTSLKSWPPGFFWVNTLFPLLPSVHLIPLNFSFSSLIRFSSAASYCFIAFLFLVSLLALAVSASLLVTCFKMDICVSGTSGTFRLSMPRFSFAILPIEIGRSIGPRYAVALGCD